MNFSASLHRTRELEFNQIFKKCKVDMFGSALELGGGDGYQSHRIAKYAKKYICTDISESILRCQDEKVEYKVADAERLKDYFEDKTFDLVYASSLLEHLPKVNDALLNISEVIDDEGLFICVLPNQFWKILNVITYPILKFLKIRENRKMNLLGIDVKEYKEYNNNVNLERERRRNKLNIPIHGVSDSNIEEFFAFSALRWRKRFASSGFHILKVVKGPVSTGWGFGHEKIKKCFEKVHIGSADIYFLTKNRTDKYKDIL